MTYTPKTWQKSPMTAILLLVTSVIMHAGLREDSGASLQLPRSTMGLTVERERVHLQAFTHCMRVRLAMRDMC